MQENHFFQILKAAYPYLSSEVQEPLFQCLKLMEVKLALEKFEQEQEATLTACSVTDENRFYLLFEAIRPFFTDKEQEQINSLMNLFQMLQMCQNYDNTQ